MGAARLENARWAVMQSAKGKRKNVGEESANAFVYVPIRNRVAGVKTGAAESISAGN